MYDTSGVGDVRFDGGVAVVTGDDFEFAVGDAAAADDAEGDADQVPVFEFDTGAKVAVVQQDFDAGLFEFVVQGLGGRAGRRL